MRVGDLVDELGRQSGRSVICDEGLAERRVTMRLREGESVEEALSLAARAVDAELIQRQGAWIVGKRQRGDQTVLVRRVRSLDSGDVERALKTILTAGEGNLVAYKDGVVILVEAPDVIERAQRMLDELEVVQRSQWEMEVHLVTMTQRDYVDLGLDSTPSVELAVSQTIGSQAAGLVDHARLNAKLSTVLTAAQQRSSMSVEAQQKFILLDGETFSFNDETKVPVPKKSVSNEGTVQTIGMAFETAGTTVSCKIREMSARSLRVECLVEVSEVVDITSEGLPRIDSRKLSAPIIIEDGGAYLVGSFRRDRQRSGRGSWLQFGFLREQSEELIQVWIRGSSVVGPALETEQSVVQAVTNS